MTKLTIAIPTYNGAKTIRETFDSILPQLQNGVDILVSDNASTDGTTEIVREYQAKFPALRYVRNDTNVGPDRNFDLAIRRADGEFVWLFSDDDLLCPGAIAKTLDVLDRFCDIGAIFVNYSSYSSEMQCANPRECKMVEDKYCINGEEFLNYVALGPLFCSSNIVRRSLWDSFDNSRFIGTNWVHYATLAVILSKQTAYCIADPLVKAISRPKWIGNGALFTNTLILAQLVNSLSQYGYQDITIFKLLGAIANNLPKAAASAKRNGLVVTHKLLTATVREFSSRYLLSTIATLLTLLLPCFLSRWGRSIYKRLRWLFR